MEAQPATALDFAATPRIPRLRRALRSPALRVGVMLALPVVLLTLCAPFVAGHDPLAQNLSAQALAPSPAHWCGTDLLGRDVWSRLLYGGRASLTIGIGAVALAMTLGAGLGIVGGYVGGALDTALTALTDLMLAFPSILLAIAIAVVLGPSATHVALAVGIVYIPQYARLARAATLAVRSRDFITAARALGAGSTRMLTRHVLPNVLAPLIIQATLGFASAELEAAGLSYLGLGARPPQPEWGAMLAEAREAWLRAPWLALFPGAAIATLALGFSLIGDGLRGVFSPTTR